MEKDEFKKTICTYSKFTFKVIVVLVVIYITIMILGYLGYLPSISNCDAYRINSHQLDSHTLDSLMVK